MIDNQYYEPSVPFDFDSIYQKEEVEEEVDYLKESIVLGAILDFLAPKRFTKDAMLARCMALVYVTRPHYFGKPNITQAEIASKHLGISKSVFNNHVIEIRKKWGFIINGQRSPAAIAKFSKITKARAGELAEARRKARARKGGGRTPTQ